MTIPFDITMRCKMAETIVFRRYPKDYVPTAEETAHNLAVRKRIHEHGEALSELATFLLIQRGQAGEMQKHLEAKGIKTTIKTYGQPKIIGKTGV
jgi:hypothetical protein